MKFKLFNTVDLPLQPHLPSDLFHVAVLVTTVISQTSPLFHIIIDCVHAVSSGWSHLFPVVSLLKSRSGSTHLAGPSVFPPLSILQLATLPSILYTFKKLYLSH